MKVLPIFSAVLPEIFSFFRQKPKKLIRTYATRKTVICFSGKKQPVCRKGLLFEHPESCVRIPMRDHPDARSLNLSNSVAVGVYEVLRQWGYPTLLRSGKPGIQLAEGLKTRGQPSVSRRIYAEFS